LNTPPQSPSHDFAHLIDAFELALRADATADFASFLPEPEHPLFLPLLGEFIRIDMEHSWAVGRGRRLSHYLARYPIVQEQPVLLGAIAFEEYRQRRRAGETPSAEDYSAAFALNTTEWPELTANSARLSASNFPLTVAQRTGNGQTPPPTAVAGLGRAEDWQTGRVTITPIARNRPGSDSVLLSIWQEAAAEIPAPGATFLGFRLVEELGRGAFGRVYLARQGDLAGRPVALKVACDIADESQTLAQLQHTNIVPIYSFHRSGPFQAVCMPYFGRTTLSHVVRHISGRATFPSSGKELRSSLEIVNGAASSGDTSAKPGSDPSPSSHVLPAIVSTHSPGQLEAFDGWARLEGLSYIEAILTLGSQVAEALGHAHRRGILHRDLKPANVLLTDDGRPMLLDFNLAEDVKQRPAERASIGGTLPYMAPEHIEAYRTGNSRPDERSDLFSLGVILFELLTGRHPFPIHKRPTPESIQTMISERHNPPPWLRCHNPAISPAVEAIVRKCLAPAVVDRYQTADNLREDLDRQLNYQRLKYATNPSRRELVGKWFRRHPRFRSSSTVAIVAAGIIFALVAGGVYARERTRGLEARGRYAEHQSAFREAQLFLDDRNRSLRQLDEGLGRLRGVLNRYAVPDDLNAADEWLRTPALSYLPEAERTRVREDVGETFYLMAQVASIQAMSAGHDNKRLAITQQALLWNMLAARYGENRLPRAIREQRAVLTELLGNREEAIQLHRTAETIPLTSARDLFLVGTQLARQNHHQAALVHLESATRLDPENFSAWFIRGSSHQAVGQYEFAAMSFSSCISLRPDSAPAWTNRGLAFAGLRFRRQAIEDFDRAIALEPKLTEPYIYRAEARQAEGDLAAAEDDYTRALETGIAPARVYFLRANIRHIRGNVAGEKADRAAGFRVRPADELSWIAWAENRMGDDPAAALGFVEEGLAINPMSIPGLQLKAHLLAERLNRPDDALLVLNRAVELHPDHVPSLAGRGVVLARAGKRAEALRDAQAALRLDTRAPNMYQVACIYALTARNDPGDKREALRFLWEGLRTGFGLDIVHSDSDLDSLRKEKEFQDIVKDAEALHGPRPGLVRPKK